MFHNPEHDTSFLAYFKLYVEAYQTDNKLQERLAAAKEKANTLQEQVIALQTRSVVCQEAMLEIARTQCQVSNKFIGKVTKKIEEDNPDICTYCKKDGAGQHNGPQHHNWCTRHIPLGPTG
jgi:hypothetical protein